MEHWFDSLSRPHTRRTTLKAAAVAGAALFVPALRASRAWAIESEPCYKACVTAAGAQMREDEFSCGVLLSAAAESGLSLAGSPIGVLAFVGSGIGFLRCHSGAQLAWRRHVLACRGSECSDPKKYPGGKAPAKVCDPTQEIKCGDDCCNSLKVCCQCKNGGTYICCIDAEHCEPDPNGNRGSCCPAA